MTRLHAPNRRDASLAIAFGAIGPMGLVARPLHARSAAPHRIGALWSGVAPVRPGSAIESALIPGLREVGHEPGRTIEVIERFGETPDKLAQAAADLLRLRVELIVAGGPAPLMAARAATRTVPIVTIGGGDPVAEGWAESLARPGRNVTGLTVTYPELMPKRLELLRWALPQATRVAVLHNPDELVGWDPSMAQLEAAGRGLDFRPRMMPVRRLQDLGAALETAKAEQAQALMAVSTNFIVTHRATIAARALALKLPTVGDFRLLAVGGFMFTYGANLEDLIRRAGGYIDRILKGARPGDLPIERPTQLQLVLNLKTIRALGLALPPAFVQQADETLS